MKAELDAHKKELVGGGSKQIDYPCTIHPGICLITFSTGSIPIPRVMCTAVRQDEST
jgi:hypothetical protein